MSDDTSPSAAFGAIAPLPRAASRVVPVAVFVIVLAALGGGASLIARAESKTNDVALAAAPKPVTVIAARAATYQPSRSYVGTLEPWLSAQVGPQLVSAYVDTVLVRPGAVVKRGEVLATLDCRDRSAESLAAASEARAVDARRRALAAEAARLAALRDKSFVSPNEAEQKAALSSAEEAKLQAMMAKLSQRSIEVGDCVLRAPFDGEIATRSIDPGAFVRPGVPLVSVVDRSTVRLVADVPEIDFPVVAPGRKVRITIAATGRALEGEIARRAPAADPLTRTVRFEVDLADPERRIPVGTTGEAQLDVGEPAPATAVPLYAASVRGAKASIFLVEGGVAHARVVPVLGETRGRLFLSPDIPAGAELVTEGRALLTDGDHVAAKMDAEPPPAAARKEPPR